MSQPERITRLNDLPPREGRYVLYWMQQSQRARFNPALEFAAGEANDRELPLVVGFGLTADYPEANARHYAFMLQGLQDVVSVLQRRGIGITVRLGSPDDVALELSRDAALVVCDRGYLRHQKGWRQRVAGEAGCAVVQVEGDVVVPVDVVSEKQEFAARTIRPKIQRHRDEYLVGQPARRMRVKTARIELPELLDLFSLDVDHRVHPVQRFRGGENEARRRLAAFVQNRLAGYGGNRNEPGDWRCSFLSPYLHFGQISPVEVALAVRRADHASDEDRAAFLEELIVRRELSINYVHHNRDYDRYRGLPEWARRTLDEHRDDPREHVYSRRQLESARTHDRYWNAAMREMVRTGFMHNYMRMYWGKKILEWSNTPEHAFRTALCLNNRYFLDGRDANSFVGVGWCFGLHDRPWAERAVFGRVRYMNDRGLERKFDMDRYIDGVEELVNREG